MPEGCFYKFDFNEGIPSDLLDKRFDYIVSSYAIHHVNNDAKVNFILQLKNIFKYNGKIIIADVAFETQEDHDNCKKSSGEEWDTDEIYFISEDIIPKLEEHGLEVEYIQISHCAGVLIVTQ